ncbi:SgcJ/EcaC family oxidoreductase [Spiractinospora alimapuensis]|uniref:SgcJ/EcaC family oxidoreductase n=1 Tax=Spiractinospora alimapuensis TaxID=2820884 RepID=UPI001F3E06B9|nr:SgcJ/EcaC family oxidoreductase [Spiractinospora alimapuensis]QVQ54210.1 SgcJ/EcaC family oxidoreductase [Spiractinospora alimapuensis]
MTTSTHRTQIAPEIVDKGGDHEADRVAIAAIVKDVEDGFNGNDAGLLVEHFAENGYTVNAFGGVLTGRGAMAETNAALLAGPLREETARYELDHVEFLRPDVAVARKLAWATDADGTPRSERHSMIATYVLVKEGDRWWVTARQNTTVPEA